MLKKTLNNPVEGFEVDQISGGKFAITWKNKSMKLFKICTVLVILLSIFFSAVLLAAYFKGEKVYDGQAIPLWFISVFLAVEWLPIFFVLWFLFARKIFFFDYKTFEIRIKRFGLIRQKFALEKKQIHKLVLINQSENSSLYALKIHSDNNEHAVLWMRPYKQCQWLGTVIAEWSGRPLEE